MIKVHLPIHTHKYHQTTIKKHNNIKQKNEPITKHQPANNHRRVHRESKTALERSLRVHYQPIST